MGRALAHARASVRGFEDPFALRLLPDDQRVVVERVLRDEWPRTLREAKLRIIAQATERMMGPRTVEIDDGIRTLPRGHQLVIVGAGLDARAYRMSELEESIAFELDHPATQAFKLRQVEGLRPRVRELRHVAVDFTRETLGDALARVGHDPAVPTAWVFEGVMSYLTPPDVAKAIEAMAVRSARGSRLLATYNEPSWIRRTSSAISARDHEPQRAAFTPENMRSLLAQRGFVVRSDRDGRERAARWDMTTKAFDRFWRFHHVVIADVTRDPRRG
jgi:methyltransferase (TIGR00027 family)